jgi:hypothetical protein
MMANAAAWVYALDGRRLLLDWQCSHLLGLGNTQLPLFYVIQDLRRGLGNLLAFLDVASTYPDQRCRLVTRL